MGVFVVSSWVGYEHEHFRGRQYLWDMSDRGEYNCTDRWCGQGDHISSVRSVKQVRHSLDPLWIHSKLVVSLNCVTTFPWMQWVNVWSMQDTNPPRAQLFERQGFSGRKIEIHDDIPNLMTRYNLNRTSSIRVLGGAWVSNSTLFFIYQLLAFLLLLWKL